MFSAERVGIRHLSRSPTPYRFVELNAFGDPAHPIHPAIVRQFGPYNQECGPKPLRPDLIRLRPDSCCQRGEATGDRLAPH